jgi:hypothetical protein
MSQAMVDRNLLLGILAVQKDIILPGRKPNMNAERFPFAPSTFEYFDITRSTLPGNAHLAAARFPCLLDCRCRCFVCGRSAMLRQSPELPGIWLDPRHHACSR